MTTMLEKAARATYAKWIEDVRDLEPEWDALPESHRARLIDATRAALQAIRAPDEAMIHAGNDAPYGCTEGIGLDRLLEGPAPDYSWEAGLGLVFTAMIDAILSEGEA